MNDGHFRDVSRETLDQLSDFADLVYKWNAKINLVARSTASEVLERHIADSYQLVRHAPESGTWVDLGSGGGFPGIVLAIATRDQTGLEVSMIESDTRKCAFLREAIRTLKLRAKVHNARIEKATPFSADVVSARALAPLHQLLAHMERHANPTGRGIFMKGQTWQDEVQEAEKTWDFEHHAIQSQTNPAAAILEISDLSRA